MRIDGFIRLERTTTMSRLSAYRSLGHCATAQKMDPANSRVHTVILDCFDVSYGTLVYQERIMQVRAGLTNYSLWSSTPVSMLMTPVMTETTAPKMTAVRKELIPMSVKNSALAIHAAR